MDSIRNFCIIAHIDHGKSTLADRFLELTKTVDARQMKDQLLDQMDLEREKGITIKLQPVTMNYTLEIKNYTLNLIDTPGHVDFGYEVSRSIAAVEGAILLVDATQGVQAQTLSTLAEAQKQNLKIIPVVNKIDLPASEPEKTAEEIMTLLGVDLDDIIFASGKTGEGVDDILKAIIQNVPAPQGNPSHPLRALIFDSFYDSYRGVIALVRIFDGNLKSGDRIKFMKTNLQDEALEVGYLKPKMHKKQILETGEIGYIVTNVKDVSEARVGDTITLLSQAAIEPLPGYRETVPMVYAGFFPADGEINDLRDALQKLKLNDASLVFEPDNSKAFGFGFRCGFLGLLHLEIIKERISREFNLELIVTTPSVAYEEYLEQGKTQYREPIVHTEIIAPERYMGGIMDLAQSKRGIYKETEYLNSANSFETRVILHYELPLASIITEFYDALKSVSQGYASLHYRPIGYKEDDLVKLDILVAGDPIDTLARIVHRKEALGVGKSVVKKLKDLIPKHQFQISLQAAVGGKIIAREDIPALRKDVTAKLYGGDRSRKDKLLKKQKAGKKRLKKLGRVDVPSDVFIKLLK